MLGFNQTCKKLWISFVVLLPQFSGKLKIKMWCSESRKLLDLMCFFRVMFTRLKILTFGKDSLGWSTRRPWSQASEVDCKFAVNNKFLLYRNIRNAFSGYLGYDSYNYKIISIVSMFWLVEKPFYIRVSKHGFHSLFAHEVNCLFFSLCTLLYYRLKKYIYTEIFLCSHPRNW